MKNFKRRKVFDCQDMPNEVKNDFFNRTNKGNDTYVDWYVHDKWKIVGVTSGKQNKVHYIDNGNLDERTDAEVLKERKEDGLIKIVQRGEDIVSDWLVDNGAKVHEEVIIKHWW